MLYGLQTVVQVPPPLPSRAQVQGVGGRVLPPPEHHQHVPPAAAHRRSAGPPAAVLGMLGALSLPTGTSPKPGPALAEVSNTCPPGGPGVSDRASQVHPVRAGVHAHSRDQAWTGHTEAHARLQDSRAGPVCARSCCARASGQAHGRPFRPPEAPAALLRPVRIGTACGPAPCPPRCRPGWLPSPSPGQGTRPSLRLELPAGQWLSHRPAVRGPGTAPGAPVSTPGQAGAPRSSPKRCPPWGRGRP